MRRDILKNWTRIFCKVQRLRFIGRVCHIYLTILFGLGRSALTYFLKASTHTVGAQRSNKSKTGKDKKNL